MGDYTVSRYSCGLSAGDKVRLLKDIVVHYANGQPTGRVHEKGETWKVLYGSPQDPGVIWLLQPDGERHTWDDDPSIFEWFEKIE